MTATPATIANAGNQSNLRSLALRIVMPFSLCPNIRNRPIAFFEVQDALGRAIQILILPRPQTPEERHEPHAAHQERNRQQNGKGAHKASTDCAGSIDRVGPFQDKRSAFATTTSEEMDMAIAAIKGVTSPAIAIGTKSTL